jgi:hypothetical protein
VESPPPPIDGSDWNLNLEIFSFQTFGTLIFGIWTELEFDGRMGVMDEVIERNS